MYWPTGGGGKGEGKNHWKITDRLRWRSLGLPQTGDRMPGDGQPLQVWNRSAVRAAEFDVQVASLPAFGMKPDCLGETQGQGHRVKKTRFWSRRKWALPASSWLFPLCASSSSHLHPPSHWCSCPSPARSFTTAAQTGMKTPRLTLLLNERRLSNRY